MPITNSGFKKYVEDAGEKIRKDIIRKTELAVQVIGFDCVNEARSTYDYTDQTGNLTSSMGCAVLNNGQKTYEDTKLSERGTDRHSGLNAANQMIDRLLSEYQSGIVMVVFAAMPYATDVENRHKKIVLSTASLLCDRLCEEELLKLGFIKRA